MISNGTHRRVVITGCGVVSSLGNSCEETWHAVLAGRCGVSSITLFDASSFPVKWGAEVKNFDVRPWLKIPKAAKLMDRKTQFGVAAARQAVRAAALEDFPFKPERFGCYLGAGASLLGLDEIAFALARQGVTSAGDVRGFEQSCISYLNPLYVLPRLPNMSAAHIAQQLNVQGPNNTSVFDSAAALQAIGEGARWIQRGDADLVLAGGADTRVTPLTLLSLEQCEGLLSRRPGAERAPASFDLDRDGFALGEGAGVVLMEEYEHSRQRGARPYAEIAGYASATDPAPIGQMNDKGAALSRAIEEALQEARCGDVDGILAAGLATRQHDLGESAAIHSTLGRKAAVTALKGALGNTMTAAGGIEVALAIRGLAEGVLPPIAHLRQPDPECDLNCVMDAPRPGEYRTILINAVALAGLNCALILKRV